VTKPDMSYEKNNLSVH